MDSLHLADILRRLATNKTVVKVLVALHVFVYRLTGGRVGGRLANLPVLLLTTRGRRSGLRRTVALCYLPVLDAETKSKAYAVVGSYGGSSRHPQWYQNLTSNPVAEVEIGKDRFCVTAVEAPVELRNSLWLDFCRSYPGYSVYEAATTRKIPVVLLQR